MRFNLSSCSLILSVLFTSAGGHLLAAPWWSAPALKGVSAELGNTSGAHYANLDASGTYLVVGAGYTKNETFALFEVAELDNASQFLAPSPVWRAKGESEAWDNGLRGGAASLALGRVLSGTTGGTYKDWNVSFPLTPPVDRESNVFAIYNDSGVIFDSCDFTAEGDILFSNSYAAPRNRIWRWSVLNGLASSGTNLVALGYFDASATRIRSLNAYRIDSKDYIFYGEGASGSGNVYCYDFTTDTETLLVAGVMASDIMNVKVSGIGTSQMHLHVQANDRTLQIFELESDLSGVKSQVADFSTAEMDLLLGGSYSHLRSYEVSNDERYAYLVSWRNPVQVRVLAVAEELPAWQPPATQPWWRAPVEKFKLPVTLAGSGHFLNKDESELWLTCGSAGAAADQVYLFSLAGLRAARSADSVAALQSISAATAGLGASPGLNGGALSDDLRLYLSGATGGNGYLALPTTGDWSAETALPVTNDSGIVFSTAAFSRDSSRLYSNSHTGDKSKLWRWNVIAKLAGGGVNLAALDTLDSRLSQIDSLSAYYIGGRDLLYAGEGASQSGYVYVYDFEAASATRLLTLPGAVNIASVKVGNVIAGCKGGEMTLYVLCRNGALYIYRLNPDGKSIGALLRSFTAGEMATLLGGAGNIGAFEISDDETHAFFTRESNSGNLYVLWTTPQRPRGKVITRPWYNNTERKYVFEHYRKSNSAGTFPSHMNKDASDRYLLMPVGWAKDDAYYVYDIATLRQAHKSDEVLPLASGCPTDFYGAEAVPPTFRAGAISDILGRVLSGFCYPSVYGVHSVSMPVSGDWERGVNLFSISNSVNAVAQSYGEMIDFNTLDFSQDSQFVWATQFPYGDGRETERNLYKWRVVGGLDQDGTGLVLNHIFTSSQAAIDAVEAYSVHGRDLLFYAATDSVYAYDPATEREILLLTGSFSAEGTIMKVCGLKRGLPHLYMRPRKQGLQIYELADDCLSVRRLVKSFSEDELMAMSGEYHTGIAFYANAMEVTDDEKFFFFIGEVGTYIAPLHVYHQPETGSILLLR